MKLVNAIKMSLIVIGIVGSTMALSADADRAKDKAQGSKETKEKITQLLKKDAFYQGAIKGLARKFKCQLLESAITLSKLPQDEVIEGVEKKPFSLSVGCYLPEGGNANLEVDGALSGNNIIINSLVFGERGDK